MGKHVWTESDFLAQPRPERVEGAFDSPRPAGSDGRPPGARRFVFYGLLGAFALILALAAAWLTLGRIGWFGPLPDPVSILVVGIDQRQEDIGRTDTILVVKYDPPKQRVEVVWVPRDTRVRIPGYNYHQKVNVAYSLGGVDLTRRTVEQLLGVKIDYHLLVDFRGFVEAVDALGGVPVKIARAMDYDDQAQDLHIHLKPGEHLLSGVEALGFVRYRSDGLGDISLVDPVNNVYEGRLARQQQFVHAAVKTLLKPQNLWRLPGLLRIASRSVETDMPLGEMIVYARAARGLTRGSLSTAILPGEGRTVGGASYWVPASDAVEHLVAREEELGAGAGALQLPDLKEGLAKVAAVVAKTSRPLPPARISVLNGTGEPGIAARVADVLKSEGFTVASVGNAQRYGQEVTRVIDIAGREDAVARLKEHAPGLARVSGGEAGEQFPPDVDLVLVVGADFRLKRP